MMDFVVGLLRTVSRQDAIWVVIDRFSKVSHFIPISMTYSIDKLATLYIKEIVRLHGVPVFIVLDRDARFTSRFWESVQRALETILKFSIGFHPQTDGQFERTIHILEDMLKAYVMDFQGSWNHYISLIEFAYNNSFQTTISVARYELLYGRKYRSLIHWDEVGERRYLGPDIVRDTIEAVEKIRKRILAAQDRHKFYADPKR